MLPIRGPRTTQGGTESPRPGYVRHVVKESVSLTKLLIVYGLQIG